MLKRLIFIGLLLGTTLATTYAQDPRLAREYFANGEFEKAADIYKKLHEQNRNNDYYYERYLTTLLELADYKSADEMLRKSIKANPDKLERFVDYGNLYELQSQAAQAKDQYEKAIKAIPADPTQVVKLANAFVNRKKYEYAIQCYEKGTKLIKEKHIFAYELGAVYHLKGDVPKMIESYLDALDYMPSRLTNIEAFFQRDLPATGGYDELKKQLYARIQKNADNTIYPELLIWVFMQEGDYAGALRQSKALDKRLAENGSRIFRLAQAAIADKKYDAGIEAYEYIVKEKGIESQYYIDSKQSLLAAKRNRLLEGFAYTRPDLVALEKEYEQFLDEFGRGRTTAIIMQELADFEAKYLNNLDKAIAILEEVVKMPQLPRQTQAECKLELGDYYLMKGESWEATLLYSQVDKDQKDAPLGEVARFKNAKLSYYRGDFEWSQGQLDVLKGSTSELISNDAIDLSVFIMEHYNLDTTTNSMRLYAEADLLSFQNRDDEAIRKMDSIAVLYKGHGLEDDVLHTKANIAYKRRQYEQAVKYLQQIVTDYKDGIWVDNALYRMAEIYETRLNNPAKAMELYDKIIIDHSGSTFVVESRKRYRQLRGDNMP